VRQTAISVTDPIVSYVEIRAICSLGIKGGNNGKTSEPKSLSPELSDIWDFVTYRYLILATPDFIVFIDDEPDVDWKTTTKYDRDNQENDAQCARIINHAAALEAADRDNSSDKQTLNFKRQIGEVIARAFEGHFDKADEMLQVAEQCRLDELQRRKDAIAEQIKVKDHWLKFRKIWTVIHYAIGIAALVVSSLAASKAEALGLNATITAWFSWLTVICTAVLTFPSPERKSNKYARAWSVLNNQIALYQADYQIQLKDVIDSYNQGENILFDTDTYRKVK
jgi:hypothetical protein